MNFHVLYYTDICKCPVYCFFTYKVELVFALLATSAAFASSVPPGTSNPTQAVCNAQS